MKSPTFALPPELVKLIGEIDEFKGRWTALERLSPERLSSLRKVATIESVGSSTRIEGAKLSDVEVETLLSNLERTAFLTRDEQEVPELSVRVLELLRRHERRTSAELAVAIGANPNTLKLRLRELVDDGRVRRHGKGRATWYSLLSGRS